MVAAHAIRKFFDAFKSSTGQGIGKLGLAFIKKLYEIEEEIQGLPYDTRFYNRLRRSLPIIKEFIKEFKKWLDEQANKLNPESLAGKAVKYTRNE